MLRIALIFVAGGAGCLLRFGLVSLLHRPGVTLFPIGTLAANAAGCLLVGLLAALFTGPIPVREEFRFAIIVGLLGGFTTFSSFAYETLHLHRSGEMGLAMLNLLLSNGLGLLGVWLGGRIATAMGPA